MGELINVQITSSTVKHAYQQVDLKTLPHAVDVNHDRIYNSSLRDLDMVVADFPMFRKEGGNPVLYLARSQ